MPQLTVLTTLVLLAQWPVPAPPPQTPAPSAPVPADALQVQVMLDRAGFSPGAIDGRMGQNTQKALALFREKGNQQAAAVKATTTYRITADDVAGPYVGSTPEDMMEQAKLAALRYATLLESLSERFHCTPALLQQLNQGINFAADQDIQVPNVDPMVAPVETTITPAPAENGKPRSAQPTAPAKPEVIVTVARRSSAITVSDPSGAVIFYAPVTTGSEYDPLPIGDWKVTSVHLNPIFRYNPDLFWDADPSHTKATIPPGPNNPVGLVWIGISKEHYGLHGTPEPSTIGRTQSHGCVRLTNWDALKLAGLVQAGTRVVFTE